MTYDSLTNRLAIALNPSLSIEERRAWLQAVIRDITASDDPKAQWLLPQAQSAFQATEERLAQPQAKQEARQLAQDRMLHWQGRRARGLR